jgi:hypothetical protein
MVGEGRAFRQHCEVLGSGVYTTLNELIARKEPLTMLEGVRARRNVRVEVRGYHALDNVTPCSDVGGNSSNLIFWGSTDWLDLDDPSLTAVSVTLECRPRCDCRFIDEGGCEAELEEGVCAPAPSLECSKERCREDDVCFGGRLDCVDQLCQPLSDSDICAACTSGADCDSNICVHHTFSDTNTEIDEQLCLEACPPVDGSAMSCPSGMSCKRLDGVLFEKVGD